MGRARRPAQLAYVALCGTDLQKSRGAAPTTRCMMHSCATGSMCTGSPRSYYPLRDNFDGSHPDTQRCWSNTRRTIDHHRGEIAEWVLVDGVRGPTDMHRRRRLAPTSACLLEIPCLARPMRRPSRSWCRAPTTDGTQAQRSRCHPARWAARWPARWATYGAWRSATATSVNALRVSMGGRMRRRSHLTRRPRCARWLRGIARPF